MHVLLIDDHPLMLDALATVVQGLEDAVSVTRIATGCAARSLIAQRHGNFDLVLLDLHLSDVNGISLLQEVHKDYPELPVVIVSGSENKDDIALAIKSGALGFVPKRVSNQVLLGALRHVRSGGVYFPESRQCSSEVDPEAESFEELNADVLRTVYETPSSLSELGLTPRQQDTLICLIQGKSNKAIARELGISTETVKNHVNGVMRTLGVNSRLKVAVAVSQVIRLGDTPWRPSQAS